MFDRKHDLDYKDNPPFTGVKDENLNRCTQYYSAEPCGERVGEFSRWA